MDSRHCIEAPCPERQSPQSLSPSPPNSTLPGLPAGEPAGTSKPTPSPSTLPRSPASGLNSALQPASPAPQAAGNRTSDELDEFDRNPQTSRPAAPAVANKSAAIGSSHINSANKSAASPDSASFSGLGGWDITVVIGYIIVIMGVSLQKIMGVSLARSRNRAGQDKNAGKASEFFLGGRGFGWPLIGVALFGTNISTVHIIGLAGAGFSTGLVIGSFEWFSMFFLAMLSIVFAPIYYKNQLSTLPEYLERRFSKVCRTILAITTLMSTLMIQIGLSLYASTLMVQVFLPTVHPVVALLSMGALTAMYALHGGLRSVVCTQAIQVVVILLSFTVLAYRVASQLQTHGIASLDALHNATTNVTTQDDLVSMVRSYGDYRFYYLVLGSLPIGLWNWCSDQTTAQSILGAKSLADAQLGPIFAGFIKIMPVPLFVFPGVAARVLYKDEVGGTSDMAMFVLIENLAPPGLKGFMFVAMVSSLMSTVAAALNSMATLMAVDIFLQVRPNLSDNGLVVVGRLTATVILLLSVAWATHISICTNLYEALNRSLACLSPPISATFILGVTWARGTQQAAVATMGVGLAVGCTVFVLDFGFCDYNAILTEVGVPYMMQSWWQFLFCCLIFVVVSLKTSPPAPEKTDKLCLHFRSRVGIANPIDEAGQQFDRLGITPIAAENVGVSLVRLSLASVPKFCSFPANPIFCPRHKLRFSIQHL
eukprot:SAG31_NODE_3376_length_4349_cov_1.760471_2_plen_710_part_00